MFHHNCEKWHRLSPVNQTDCFTKSLRSNVSATTKVQTETQLNNTMLNRIISIKNIGRFEQLKAANGNEGDFAKINVIYAVNI